MSRINLQVLAGIFVLMLLTVFSITAEATELQWFGQSAFKITTPGGKVILVDPFITKNPKTPKEFKDLNRLGKVDLILITHGHGDHIGDTVYIAQMAKAKVALNADMGHTFASLGWVPYKQMIRFNKGGPVRPIGQDITITMVHAEHSSEVLYTNPESKEKEVYPGGEPAGYIIELENTSKFTMRVIRGCLPTCDSSASMTNRTWPYCQLADISPWTRHMLPMQLRVF